VAVSAGIAGDFVTIQCVAKLSVDASKFLDELVSIIVHKWAQRFNKGNMSS
jgi:hypothetical protein